MTAPPNLKKGDKIGIIAPARKISKEDIQFAIDTFQNWGLEVTGFVFAGGGVTWFSNLKSQI